MVVNGIDLFGIAAVLAVFIAFWRGKNRAATAALPANTPPPAPLPVDDLIEIESLGEPALLINPTFRIVAANDLAAQLFGNRLREGPLRGQDIRQTLRHPQLLDLIRRAISDSTTAIGDISGLTSSDSRFQVRASLLSNRNILVVFIDLTAIALTERMRVDFVANASHELRTPLATLMGFIETLQGPAADDTQAQQKFLSIMAAEASRMTRLIDDLLTLSRIERDKYVRPQEQLELPPLIESVAHTLAMQLAADGRSMSLELPDNLVPILAERDQIVQILHNLVSNALKYGRSGTAITLRAERLIAGVGQHESMVKISVIDIGDGIAADFLPRLTERFYRVDASRSRSMGGTGLGLAITKHIVERHRGTLEIFSEINVGTRVSFTLPEAPH